LTEQTEQPSRGRRRTRRTSSSRPGANGAPPKSSTPNATLAFSPATVSTDPIAFDALGLDPDLLAGVQDRGFEHTTPVQTAVLPIVREGRDLIACAETGTGKTAAFVLPILERLIQRAKDARANGGAPPPSVLRVLVLTPTRELAVQIDDDVQGFAYRANIGSAAIYGGVPMGPQLRALEAGVPIVVATPGRLMDHMRSGAALFDSLEVLVLDEADRMLDMGFWPDVRRIVSAMPTERQTLLFSATMPDEVVHLASAILREPLFVQVGQRNAAATTITHEVENVPTGEKTNWLVRFLRREPGPILIFVRTKHGADRLASRLSSAGLRVAALHADRSQRERLAAVEGLKSGRHRVLVATDIAARGLDIDGITHVINYDTPHSSDAYVHRVGRTGRARATGTALTLVSPGEERALRAITARLELAN
jgi:ATP-dependent RNA helicase RhlE